MSEEIWFFAHLIVPLIWLSKVLTFGKPQINLVFLSLNRTFVPKLENHDDDKKISSRYSDVLAHQA